jgi:hypothetical protein
MSDCIDFCVLMDRQIEVKLYTENQPTDVKKIYTKVLKLFNNTNELRHFFNCSE